MADYTPEALAAFGRLNAASKAHMEALAKLVQIPSRTFKADAMQRDWIDRSEVMRLVMELRDQSSALAAMLRAELNSAHGVGDKS